MIENHTGIGVFDEFDKCFSEKAIGICPLLSKYPIHVYTKEQYIVKKDENKLPDVDFDNTPFAYGKDQAIAGDASTMNAVIVCDETFCETLKLSDEEKLASIAHEVGHIILYFLTNNVLYDQEKKADEYVATMGLGYPLKSVLMKLVNSGLYSEEYCEYFNSRISHIESVMDNGWYFRIN